MRQVSDCVKYRLVGNTLHSAESLCQPIGQTSVPSPWVGENRLSECNEGMQFRHTDDFQVLFCSESVVGESLYFLVWNDVAQHDGISSRCIDCGIKRHHSAERHHGSRRRIIDGIGSESVFCVWIEYQQASHGWQLKAAVSVDPDRRLFWRDSVPVINDFVNGGCLRSAINRQGARAP